MTEKKAPEKGDEAALAESVAQAQEKVDAEQERGYRGTNPDITPNEHYTFAGAAAGKPTPETDPHLAAAVGRPFLEHAGATLPHPLRAKAEKHDK
jgi:hypothetical protein